MPLAPLSAASAPIQLTALALSDHALLLAAWGTMASSRQHLLCLFLFLLLPDIQVYPQHLCSGPSLKKFPPSTYDLIYCAKLKRDRRKSTRQKWPHPCGAHMVTPKELPRSQRHHTCLLHSTWNKTEQKSAAPHTKPALMIWKQVGGTSLRGQGAQTCTSTDIHNETRKGRVSRRLTSCVTHKDPWFFPKNQKRTQPVYSGFPNFWEVVSCAVLGHHDEQ